MFDTVGRFQTPPADRSINPTLEREAKLKLNTNIVVLEPTVACSIVNDDLVITLILMFLDILLKLTQLSSI